MTKLWFLKPVALAACVSGAFFVACSSSSTPGNTDNNGDGGVTTPAGNGSCTSQSLTLAFSPMYSAFDGQHTFQIPVEVKGVSGTDIKWSASDTSMVSIAPDPTTGIAMLTTLKAGTVTIAANAGGLCGQSTLTIASATPADWQTGSDRYNNGVVIHLGRPDAAAGDSGSPDQAACTNCHGESATNFVFKTISHTPEQTGGFSDQDLTNIFLNGEVPDGGYFDDSIVPYQAWSRFHQWTLTDDEAKGVVVYLRSLTPSAQTGGTNFGQRPDGGGRPPRDGGGGGQPDAGSDLDAGTTPSADAAAE